MQEHTGGMRDNMAIIGLVFFTKTDTRHVQENLRMWIITVSINIKLYRILSSW